MDRAGGKADMGEEWRVSRKCKLCPADEPVVWPPKRSTLSPLSGKRKGHLSCDRKGRDSLLIAAVLSGAE